jgi:hypothetical protein
LPLPPYHGINGGAMSLPIPPYPILFNQTPESLRRGGRACARNRRLRQRCHVAGGPWLGDAVRAAEETTAQAVAALDAQFPWLRQAERRHQR